jgi:erythrin-vacuolar iron transport family protein
LPSGLSSDRKDQVGDALRRDGRGGGPAPRGEINEHRRRFGDAIPLIRREHVAGFYHRRPVWLIENLGIERTRDEAGRMEAEAPAFYLHAAKRTSDAGTRQLLGRLAAAESHHETSWQELTRAPAAGRARRGERGGASQVRAHLGAAWPRRLMDGSVSTLAPIFAAAFATGDTWRTFLVGLAASVGAGISMGFTEAVSDDGTISGRGSPVKRGLASGVMTTIGGLGHALPYLIPQFWTATTIAMIVVFIELWAIAWVQNRYMETPFWRAALQVVVGGSLVFASGILIGSA